MMVKELSQAANVSADSVRYYTRIGLLKPERDRNNGYKLFTDTDVKRLRFIRRAQSLGYTLAEIQHILDHAHSGKSPCPLVRDIIRKRIEDNRVKLDELKALQERMENALQDWEQRGDGVPDGDTVCYLIDLAGEE